MKIRSKTETYTFTSENIDLISEEIQNFLEQLGTERKNILRMKLTVEDLLLRLRDHFGEDKTFVFSTGTRLGKPYINIETAGEQFDPTDSNDDFGEVTGRLSAALGLYPSYAYSKKNNIISFKLKKKHSNPVMTLLMTLLSACIAGVIGLLIPGNFRQVSYDLLLTPLYNAFIGVVSTLAGPMIFLSVCWGIYGIGDAATLGKIGKRMLLRYIAFTGIVVIAALCVQLPFAGLQYAYSDIDTSDLTKIVELLLSVFPKNIISPFLDGNTMQIIVMAIAVGSIMLILDNQTNTIAAIIEQANYIIHYLIELISHVIPAFIFIIMLRLIWSDSISQMRTVWKPYITYLLVSTVVVFSIIAFVAYKEKVSIRTLLKKLLPSFLTALSTASSAASFGIAVSTCESELGVNSKVTNFGLPLGIVLFKPIAAVSFLTFALYFTKQYQMSISFIWVISFIIVITILAIALPPLPGGAFACYAILFNQLGLPAEALGIVMILDAFSDFTTTGFDTVLRQCELVLSSDKVNMLNKAKLRKQSAR